jgi:hypothetical protein
MRLDIRHVFACSPATYWDVFWDDEFDRRLDDAAGVRREPLTEWEDAGRRCWRVRFTPREGRGGAEARLLGADLLTYEQENCLDQERGVLEWRVFPNLPGVGGSVRARGTMTVRPVERGCERVVEGVIEVGIPLIGGRVERAIARGVEESYEQTAELTARWIAENDLTGR